MATDKSKKQLKITEVGKGDKKKEGKKAEKKTEKSGKKGEGKLGKAEKIKELKEQHQDEPKSEQTSEPVEVKATSASSDDLHKREVSTAEKALFLIGDSIKKAAEKIFHPSHEPKKEEAVEATEPVIPQQKSSSGSAVEDKKDTLKVTFQVKYSTKFGQQLYVTGNYQLLGNNNLHQAFPMEYFNADYWNATIEIPKSFSDNITYNYYIKLEDGSEAIDWGNDKIFNPSSINSNSLLLLDIWNYAGYYENVFYSEPFQKVLLKKNFTSTEAVLEEDFTHTFKVKAPLLLKGQRLFIAGNVPELSSWNTIEPLLLSIEEDGVWWQIQLNLSSATFPIQYKYGVYDVSEKKVVQYEAGANRHLLNKYESDEKTIITDGFANIKNNAFKGAGVAIPVFSLRSGNGLGIGEFNDLKQLVDWAKKIGLKLIQILPINDTTATYTNADSYPYAAISAFALHPVYLNLALLVNEENKSLLTELKDKQAQLNSLDAVDYSTVLATKLDFIRKVFPLQKQETFDTPEFKTFFQSNAHWLVPYAAFSYFRDKYKTANFTQWPTNQTFVQEEIDKITGSISEADESLSVYYFIQYHLHLQLKTASDYAHENGIIVKGDIPIGIFRNSCDAWQEPELYNMDMQAGAPPDDFAVKGQNWGFPTYNWQKMAMDGFSWWKRRFKQMSYYFDAFRIDHILGFFRIWSSPLNAVEGILGRFVPAIPVHISEFYQRGIYIENGRYSKPFITDTILWETFGNEAEPVKRQFLNALNDHQYELLPEFDTQLKVENYFAGLEQSSFNKKLKQGLFDLISNVLLFEVEGSQGQQFHFRISIESTSSFKSLDEGTQARLYDLYINYFFRRQDDFWKQEAMMKLPELKRSTNMLICGEDLGMVPASVPGVMRDLAILSLEIQRMPKDPNLEFFNPANAPYLSVVTPSTHDMSTIRGWWEEDKEKTQKFYNQELGQVGPAPFFCEPWINTAIIIQHAFSPAMWSIFQLQDLLGIDGKIRRENPNDERINIPADPKHYWRYRMHLTIEDLIAETGVNNQLKDLVAASGRS